MTAVTKAGFWRLRLCGNAGTPLRPVSVRPADHRRPSWPAPAASARLPHSALAARVPRKGRLSELTGAEGDRQSHSHGLRGPRSLT
jgi:hypothetical protein